MYRFSLSQCDVICRMRYQFNLRDETDNIIRSIIRIHGHHTNNILVRLRALYGQDYLAYSAPPFSGRMGVGMPPVTHPCAQICAQSHHYNTDYGKSL